MDTGRIFFTGTLFLLMADKVVAQLPSYQVFFGRTTRPPQQLVLRQWQQGGQLRYLLVGFRKRWKQRLLRFPLMRCGR